MRKISTLLVAFAMTIGAMAQNADQYNAAIPNDYIKLLTDTLVETTPGFTPPVASRAFGYIGMALYQSVLGGMPGKSSLEGKLNYLEYSIPDPVTGQTYHWPTVANNAMHKMIEVLFYNATPDKMAMVHAIRDNYNNQYQGTLSQAVYDGSLNYGVSVANAVLDYAATDGANNCQTTNFPASYIPPVGDGLWTPLVINNVTQAALQPYWGTCRPFIAADGEDETMMANYLPPFSSAEGSAWHDAGLEVYNTGLNLTTEQQNIALWWADGSATLTPPGHSMSLCRQILVAQSATLKDAAMVYAMLGIGLRDAFHACWKQKFTTNSERPITYIKEYIDPNWTSLIGTPPFPEFPSGHSSQSGAMATIMTAYFGNNISFTDHTWTGNFGTSRNFSNFWAAAEEAAVSRLYGGIHFAFGNEGGLALGTAVGNNVLNLFEQVGFTSTEELAEQTEFVSSIFPNPASDAIYVQIKNSRQNALSVYDQNGKLVKQINTRNQICNIDLQDLPNGAYILSVITENGTVEHKRFMKL
jgi:hypothetical protein